MFNKTVAFSALCMGFFMVILDVTIVNVTLPTIASYFHAALASLQWVVDGYTLMFAGCLLLVGSLADRYGAKFIFQIGLLAFALTSIGCALSWSITSLITFRFLQGVAGSLLIPPSLALINQIYSDEKNRANAIGIWAALGGVACASGPFLGGVITSLVSWRAIFLINVVIGLISFVFVLKNIKASHHSMKRLKFDFLGQFFGFISIFALAYSLIQANLYGWGNMDIIIGLSVFVLSLAGFLVAEKQVKHAMIPLSLFKNKQTSMALTVSMILNLCFYGSLFALPFYFENVRHYSVLITGFALLPLPGLAVLGSYLGGKMTGRLGAGLVIFIGLLIAAIGYFGLLDLSPNGPEYILIAIPFLLIGFGVSFTTPAMTFAAIHSVEESRSGITAAVLNTVNQVGSLLGVASFGTIVALASQLTSGIRITLLISSILFLFVAVIALIVMRSRVSGNFQN
ncbi:MAG: MFS transporter [Pseudomonadota bacterium]